LCLWVAKSKLQIGILKYRPNEIWKMSANNKTILSKGWKPKISFEQGIKMTINWYKLFNNFYFDKKSKFNQLQ